MSPTASMYRNNPSHAVKQFVWVAGLCASLLLVSCSRPVEKVVAEAGPRMENETLVFPADSAQLVVLKTEATNIREYDEIRLYGRVVLDERLTARVYSPFNGRIDALVVNWGQTVQKGDALARINSPDIGTLRADLGKSRAELEQTRQAFERADSLFAQGLIAAKDVEQAKADQEKARAEFARSQSRALAYAAGSGMDQTANLLAPVAGTVVDIHANVGTEVRAENNQSGSPPLFVIGDTRKLVALLDAPESEAGRLKAGQVLSVWALNDERKPLVTKIGVVQAMIDPDSRTVKVRADIDNRDGRFKAEQFVNATALVPAGEGFVVPASAVLLSAKGSVAWVKTGEGRFERRELAVREAGFQKTRILDGVKPGESLVTEGALFLEQIHAGARRK